MGSGNIDNFERSALQLLQEINSGLLDPKLLDKSSRQRCVELLIAEGYTYQHISQVLKVSEKTVSRDVKEIRARNALSPDIQFAKETIGDFFRKALTHHNYLMRLARSKSATNSEKAQSEFLAWRVLRELIERMQSLGYLPSSPQQVVGDIFCHMQNEEEGESLEEMRKMLSEIRTVTSEAGTYTPELENQIRAIELRIEKAEIVSEVKKLKKQTQTQSKEVENG